MAEHPKGMAFKIVPELSLNVHVAWLKDVAEKDCAVVETLNATGAVLFVWMNIPQTFIPSGLRRAHRSFTTRSCGQRHSTISLDVRSIRSIIDHLLYGATLAVNQHLLQCVAAHLASALILGGKPMSDLCRRFQ